MDHAEAIERLNAMNLVDSITRTLSCDVVFSGPHRQALPRSRAWLFMFDNSHDLYEVARQRGLSQRHASVKGSKVFRIFATSEMHAFQQFTAEFGDGMNDRIIIFQLNYQ